MREGRIVAIVPVRAGSVRCPFKNSRPFGATSLLERKVLILLQVKGIDDVIVSSDDAGMLAIAEHCGAKIHWRQTQAVSGGAPFFEELVRTACRDADHVLYCPCVAPFVSLKTYEDIVRLYRDGAEDFDSIATVTSEKRFVYFNGSPLNYDPEDAVSSQDLEPLKLLNFAACIIPRELMRERRHCIGAKPWLYEVGQLEGIDIDSTFDFLAAEAIVEKQISLEDDLSPVLGYKVHVNKDTQPSEPMLLDCTLRDGGYVNNWNFTWEIAVAAYRAASLGGFHYFEIGFRSDMLTFPPKSEFGMWAYCTDDIARKMKDAVPDGCDLAVMVRLGSFSANDFVEASSSAIKLVRVLFPLLDEQGKSIFSTKIFLSCRDECRKLKDKGYIVSLNLACCEQLSQESYESICDMVVDVKAEMSSEQHVTFAAACIDYLYLADTYGALAADEASTLVRKLRYELLCVQKCVHVKVGFHAHNNMGDGLDKTLAAIEAGAALVDSTISGLGRGAGNVSSEQVIVALHRKYQKNSPDTLKKLESLMSFSDRYISPYTSYPFTYRLRYGQAPLFVYTAFLGIHCNYAEHLMQHYTGLPLQTCFVALKEIQVQVFNTSTNSFSLATLKNALDKVGYQGSA